MVKFDTNLNLSLGKQISISHPEGWAEGGDYNTPKQGVGPAKPEKIVNAGAGSGEWAKGGGESNVGKQTVKPAYPC